MAEQLSTAFAGELAGAPPSLQEIHAQYMEVLQNTWTSIIQQYQDLTQQQLKLQQETLAAMQKRLAEPRPACATPVPPAQES